MKKICYLILTHDDPEHLNRMIKALDYNADFYIHIDAKADKNEFQINKDNVFFINDRLNIFWGGFNMVRATLKLIKQAIKQNTEYSHMILLSGNDYPIKSSEYIYSFFKNNQGKDFIKAINIDNLDKNTYRKFFSRTVDKNLNYDFFPLIKYSNKLKISKIINLIRNRTIGLLPNMRKKKFKNRDVYFGSQWWALSIETIENMLVFYSAENKFFDVFKTFFVPDEKFFHSLYFNMKNDDIENIKIPISIKSFDDRSKQTSMLSNLHIIHPSLKKWYTIADLDEILESDKLYVRKVSTFHSLELINELDNKIYNKREV